MTGVDTVVPPSPRHVIEKERSPMPYVCCSKEPDVCKSPRQEPKASQEVALLDDQVRVRISPEITTDWLALKLIVGAKVAVSPSPNVFSGWSDCKTKRSCANVSEGAALATIGRPKKIKAAANILFIIVGNTGIMSDSDLP
jgi:hypothetical protein